MYLRIKLTVAALALSGLAMAQNDTAFQVRYAANLGLAGTDSAIDIVNTGANNANDICVNTYVFSPDEQLVACCACRVTRNAIYSGGVKADLTKNTLTPGTETSVVIKLLATAAGAGNCNPANPGTPTSGLAAWGTTAHLANLTTGAPYGTETAFTPSTLSAAELSIMTTYCGFIQANGSHYGICSFCQALGTGPPTGVWGVGPDVDHLGALGGDKQ